LQVHFGLLGEVSQPEETVRCVCREFISQSVQILCG
jgi:hypothetical protein